MKQLVDSLERRAHPRVLRRLPCTLLVDGRVHRGSVWDLSTHGFCVETGVELRPRSGAIVAFDGPAPHVC